MRKILLAAALILCATAALAASTIDPTVPAANAPLTSAPLRQQFLRAFNDIEGIENCFEAVSAPGTPLRGQCWLDTSASTTLQTLKRYDGSQWVVEGRLDTINHAFYPSSLAVVAVDTATGTQVIGSTVLVWVPTTPAAATRTLPLAPGPGEWHAVSYQLSTGAYALTVAANTGHQILVNGVAQTSYVLVVPGSETIFRYVGLVSAVPTWIVE